MAGISSEVDALISELDVDCVVSHRCERTQEGNVKIPIGPKYAGGLELSDYQDVVCFYERYLDEDMNSGNAVNSVKEDVHTPRGGAGAPSTGGVNNNAGSPRLLRRLIRNRSVSLDNDSEDDCTKDSSSEDMNASPNDVCSGNSVSMDRVVRPHTSTTHILPPKITPVFPVKKDGDSTLVSNCSEEEDCVQDWDGETRSQSLVVSPAVTSRDGASRGGRPAFVCPSSSSSSPSPSPSSSCSTSSSHRVVHRDPNMATTRYFTQALTNMDTARSPTRRREKKKRGAFRRSSGNKSRCEVTSCGAGLSGAF